MHRPNRKYGKFLDGYRNFKEFEFATELYNMFDSSMFVSKFNSIFNFLSEDFAI